MKMNEEKFEYNGVKYEVDWGLKIVGGKSWDYTDFIKAQYPEKKWFSGKGGSYQGDWVALGFDVDGFWFQKGSFGSCSGGDMLEGIDNKEQALRFLKSIETITKIGESWKEALRYLEKEKVNGYDDLREAITGAIEDFEECDGDKLRKLMLEAGKSQG